MSPTQRMFDRIIVLVLDGLGVGAMPDVPLMRPSDVGAHTLRAVVAATGGLSLPNLERLGLGTISPQAGLRAEKTPIGVHGINALGYKGADTYLGHTVMMGAPIPNTAEELFETVRDEVGRQLADAGHRVEPAKPDQAALLVDGRMVVGDNLESDPLQTYHCVGSTEDQPYDRILDVANILRRVARVRRVVAMGGKGFGAADVRRCVELRPTGQSGVNNVALGLYTSNYMVRHLTKGDRPDVQIPTILRKAGFEVELLGKVADVIICEGAHKEPHVPTQAVLDATYRSLGRVREGLIAINVQETDLAGHGQNAGRYAKHLREADEGIGRVMSMMGPRDLLVVTGDHGNDPAIGHDKHTREYTPLLAWSPRIVPQAIYMRESLADIAATVAENFAVPRPAIGTSFLGEIRLA